jgi:hypothetical protein
MIRILAWTYEQQKEQERSQHHRDHHQPVTKYAYNRRHAAAVFYETTMAKTNNNIIIGTISTPPITVTTTHTHRHPPHIHTSFYSDRVAHNLIWPISNNGGNVEGGHTCASSYQQQSHRPGVEAEHKRAARRASKEEEEERMRLTLLERHAREKERQAKVDEEEGRLMAEWPHGMMAGRVKVARAGGMKRCVGVGFGDEVMGR